MPDFGILGSAVIDDEDDPPGGSVALDPGFAAARAGPAHVHAARL